MPNGKSVRVQCLRCGHFGVLTPNVLSRLAIGPNTPIAAFVKRLRCRKCGSQSVLATRNEATGPTPQEQPGICCQRVSSTYDESERVA